MFPLVPVIAISCDNEFVVSKWTGGSNPEPRGWNVSVIGYRDFEEF